MSKQLILCDCLGSQKLDPSALSAATGLRCSKVHKALCTTEIASAAAAIEAGDALIACAGFGAIDAECDLGGLSGDRFHDLQAFNRQTPSRIVVTDAGQDIFGDFWGVDARSRGYFPEEKKGVIFDRGFDRHT